MKSNLISAPQLEHSFPWYAVNYDKFYFKMGINIDIVHVNFWMFVSYSRLYQLWLFWCANYTTKRTQRIPTSSLTNPLWYITYNPIYQAEFAQGYEDQSPNLLISTLSLPNESGIELNCSTFWNDYSYIT